MNPNRMDMDNIDWKILAYFRKNYSNFHVQDQITANLFLLIEFSNFSNFMQSGLTQANKEGIDCLNLKIYLYGCTWIRQLTGFIPLYELKL